LGTNRNEIRFGDSPSGKITLKLVECVPNFSEGRRQEVIEAIVNEARSRNVKILDVESDADHNRSVLTFVGDPGGVKEAGLAMSAKAIELIDLNKHTGEHPRMGAVDVIPFVPISDVTMEECVQLAREFAEEFASRFKVPVYLYEAAATRPDRKNLADVRRGEFEGLKQQIGKNPDKRPDFGPNAIHPTAGATAIGARPILIAYNVNLATSNLGVAKKIARQVRGRDGGLSAVKALGFELKDRGIVQVSMNMVDYKTSQLFKAFELVRTLAEALGVQVIESEIVGLVPAEALTDTAEFYLRLHSFKKDQILERKLADSGSDRLVAMSLAAFSSEVASEKPVPGGGSVSAYAAALAAGLVSMVSRLTLKKLEYEKYWPAAHGILTESERLRARLLTLVDQDSESFAALMKAYRLPKESQLDREIRSKEIQLRLKEATQIPLETAEQAARTLSAARNLAEYANINALSDVQTAISLAHAAFLGATANVTINLPGIKDPEYRKRLEEKLIPLQRQVEKDESGALTVLASRNKG
jgi:glutamate formiminotransferase/formiminotetrahydrofolate cyclodeaminase